MEAVVYRDEYHDDGGEGNGSKALCIEGKAHLVIFTTYTDRGTYKENRTVTTIGPCDGSCRRPTAVLNEKHAELIQSFLESEMPYSGETLEKASWGGDGPALNFPPL